MFENDVVYHLMMEKDQHWWNCKKILFKTLGMLYHLIFYQIFDGETKTVKIGNQVHKTGQNYN